jgi:hypothetical protein
MWYKRRLSCAAPRSAGLLLPSLDIHPDHEEPQGQHYRRDVTLGEDASQVRSHGAPEVIAALNRGILALMDFMGIKNVAKQMRHFCAKPRDALQLLLGKPVRENG